MALANEAKYQKLLFPQEYVNVTQGSNGKVSHSSKYRRPIDIAGKDYSKGKVFAPGKMEIKYIEKKYKSHSLSELKYVETPYKKFDFLTMYCYHNIPFPNINVGDILNAGTQFTEEGTYYEPGGGASGNHSHIELWTIKNRVFDNRPGPKPEEVFYLKRGLHIFKQNKSDEHFYWLSDYRNEYKDQIKISNTKYRIRRNYNTKSTILGYAEPGYYDVLDTVENDGLTWYKIYEDMWIGQVDGCEFIKAKEEPKQPELKHIGNTLDGKKIFIEL